MGGSLERLQCCRLPVGGLAECNSVHEAGENESHPGLCKVTKCFSDDLLSSGCNEGKNDRVSPHHAAHARLLCGISPETAAYRALSVP